ncbi:universal stress protein [Pacificibacter marinus]|uniref:Stress response protein NhaX n=1 Tax=Pacificibacter marinus TaxID=658057 RepID=A0A1Y5RT43_9RHOB|nr:universal stress protein [Pacificibacter marinus]SEK41860.1 Nucleotide-binding universal stress protein, UspA family [Pacificibacter marinus]SLN24560.1 Stress response protein NhaX [Pacificibacter marinus]
MFKTILAACDGSAQSENALHKAIELANLAGAKLLILTVYRHHSMTEASLSMIRGAKHSTPDKALEENAREIADCARKIATQEGATEVRAFTRSGQPARSIVEFAKKHEADVIVLGSRGTGSIDGYFLGSVSHKVTGLASMPVLVV